MASILVVCTGNVCRSPLAEGSLRAALRARLGASAPDVASAGTAGWEGSGADPASVAAAAELGVDISDHRARGLDRDEVSDAALTIGMSRSHRDHLVRLVPDAASRTFTLKELVRLVEALPPRDPGGDPDARLREVVARADALRGKGFVGDQGDEDVADPLGMPFGAFRAVAHDIHSWCGRLAVGLFGRASVRTGVATDGE
ncbi:MAG TPA: hypothetical protein VF029_06245 [Actinomycetota bacterium]